MSESITALVDDLPSEIPVFPLSGVLLLPRGQLPLNIFEPRYVAMVEDALRSDRMIGMIQPLSFEGEALFPVGCAGRVTAFEEVAGQRYRITLTGVCRFQVVSERQKADGGYRRVVPGWRPFAQDRVAAGCLNLDRERLEVLLRAYLMRNEMTCQWESVRQTADEKLITCLAMICPFSPAEKQALLEAVDCRARASLFLDLLDMAVKSVHGESQH